ncbi:MAG: hypothetical protein ACLR23_02375 [Clostridia bacterium]
MDKLIDGIWAILEETSWVIPAHNTSLDGAKYQLPDAYRGEIRYVDLFSAETGSLLAWVYHFLKDVLEEAVPHVIVDRMQYELNRRILEPYLQYDMPWMGLDGDLRITGIPGLFPMCWRSQRSAKRIENGGRRSSHAPVHSRLFCRFLLMTTAAAMKGRAIGGSRSRFLRRLRAPV